MKYSHMSISTEQSEWPIFASHFRINIDTQSQYVHLLPQILDCEDQMELVGELVYIFALSCFFWHKAFSNFSPSGYPLMNGYFIM